MIEIAISLLFGFTAISAVMVAAISLARGAAGAQALLAELAEIRIAERPVRQRSAPRRTSQPIRQTITLPRMQPLLVPRPCSAGA
ncbi:hypothetical protein AEB_P2773 [Altererythrobacter sp. B11]|uniref:hypothetical protein n=1 Tax=Altererythrobacter sp. B11 TaxID=2060312 RepID=UPI000DC71848|nr:hypothetical protein [Altererythrobacter sp. B11]BBC73641.1 hypothetical protein AEB_P2773 [Altererythrobacter sp. B11]